MGRSVPGSSLRSRPLLKRAAYTFDGFGHVFLHNEWDLPQQQQQLQQQLQEPHSHGKSSGDDDGEPHSHGKSSGGDDHDDDDDAAAAAAATVPPSSSSFAWYHVELPRSVSRLSSAAQYLIEALCPPLKLQDILALISNGPFCGHVDDSLIFRVNSPGPTSSNYTHKLAVRVAHKLVITVSLGRIPRLGFSNPSPTQSLLTEIPTLCDPTMDRHDVGDGDDDAGGRDDDSEEEMKQPQGTHIQEHMLEFLLTMNHHITDQAADSPVPSCVSNLLVHLIDAHVDHLQDVATRLEMDLDEVELELDNGGYIMKQKMLDDRYFPRMHLDLQRLLQVIAHGEQVFPRVKDKCAGRTWLIPEDIKVIDTLVGHLQKLKENLGFLANRVTALQAGLDSWQSEQINKKLYYLSFLSIVFLPLSIVTAAFGMNVGGIPWSEQKAASEEKNGFWNVLMLCAVILVLLLACFWTGPLYNYVKTLQLNQSLRNRWLSTKKSIKWRRRPGSRGRHRYFSL